MQKGMRLMLAGLMAATLLAITPAAFAGGAKHGGAVVKQGSCSGTTDWKLKAKPDNGRLEVEFEVDQNVVGDTWSVRLKDNGMVFFKGQRTTQAPSGSFEVKARTADQAGPDMIVGQAKNLSTGETCRGSLTI
jgi:hypothetical protein